MTHTVDAVGSPRFWAAADSAIAALERLTDDERAKIAAAEAELDVVWDAVED